MRIKVVVIGAGPGGYVAAIRAAHMGGAVCVVEKENVDGACLDRGRPPSKTMKTTANWLAHIRKAHAYGIDIEGEVRSDIEHFPKLHHPTNSSLKKFRHKKYGYVSDVNPTPPASASKPSMCRVTTGAGLRRMEK